MAGLKDQRREHSGVRALEPPEPPGVPQFSCGETPASNSFGTPKPGDGVQMAGRHLDVRASRGSHLAPTAGRGAPGQGARLGPPVRGPLLGTGRQVHTALPPRAPPGHQPYVQRDNGRQLVPEAPGRGVGSRGVGGGDGTGGRSELASLSRRPPHRLGLLRQGRRGLAVLPLTRLRETGRGGAAGRPASPGRGLLPTAGEKPLAKPGAACRAASPRGAGARGSSVGGGSPRAPTGAWGVGDRVVKAASPPARCLPRGPQAALPFPRRVLAARAGTGRQPSGHPRAPVGVS